MVDTGSGAPHAGSILGQGEEIGAALHRVDDLAFRTRVLILAVCASVREAAGG